MKAKVIPIWENEYLTIYEASLYFGIGQTNLRKWIDAKKLSIVIDGKVLVNREKTEKLLENTYSI